MITLRGQILVSRTGDDPLRPRVSIQNAFRVYVQNVSVCTGSKPTCFLTCGLGAGTHGDVLNLHTESVLNVYTGFFHVFFTVPQHTKHTPRPPTTPRPQRHHHHNDTHHTTPHGDRNRERQRKRDKRRQEKTRQDKKRREEKRRDEKEERRRREKKKREDERENEQSTNNFFRECPPAPELFSRQIPENVWQRRNYLAQMSEMSAWRRN